MRPTIELLGILKDGLPNTDGPRRRVVNANAITAGLRNELPNVESAQPI
jgi:hypothetical protein